MKLRVSFFFLSTFGDTFILCHTFFQSFFMNQYSFFLLCIDSDRIAEYDMKLMDIDSDNLGIPDTEYDARVTMPSSEFTRIVRDLSQLGESVRIEVSKEGVRFASEGEAANGSVLLRQAEGATISGGKITAGTEEPKEDNEGDGDEAEASSSSKKVKVKKEKKDSNEDVEMVDDEDGEKEKEDDVEKDDDDAEKDDAEFKPDDGEEEKGDDEEAEDDEDEEGNGKKRKKKVMLFFSLESSHS